MGNRDRVVICWELLTDLASGPKKPSALARVASIPYDRLGEYLGPMATESLIEVKQVDGHAVYSVTPKGLELLHHLDPGLRMLFPALG